MLTTKFSPPLTWAAIVLAGTASLLSACGSTSTLLMAPAIGVTAEGHVQMIDSTGRRLLAAVTPWTAAEVHHLNLALKAGATTVATIAVPQADLSKAVSFANLKKSTSYQVIATAYADAGETQQIDNFAINAASCTTSFATVQNDQINIGAIQVKLRDKTFAGAADPAAITVTPGAVVDTAATETITLN